MANRFWLPVAIAVAFVAPACADTGAGASAAAANATELKALQRPGFVETSSAAKMGSPVGFELVTSYIDYAVHNPLDVLLRIPILRAHVAAHLWVFRQLGGEPPASSSKEASLIQTEQEPEPIAEATGQQPFFGADWFFGTAIATAFGILFYKQKQISGKKQDANPEKTFSGGHFGCGEDFHTCICACCCPGLRWADTINMFGVAKDTQLLGLTTFWTLFALFCFTGFADLVFTFCTAVLLTSYRQRIREVLQMPHGDCGIVTIDFLYACFCPCCLIAQEARTVNEMQLVGRLVVVDAETVPSYGSSEA